MTRTVRRDPHPFRVGVAGAAAVVLLAACGGGESSGAGSAGATRATADGEATAGDFCEQAAGIDERVDAALADEAGDPSLADAFRQLADDLRAIDAPEPISADWQSMAAGLDRLAGAFGQVDVTDLDSLEALEQAEGDLTEAGSDVDAYLADECGI